ncbi:MAG: hypothetical protein ACPG8W_20860 [Candidatus Promineifilaceae bacterium]
MTPEYAFYYPNPYWYDGDWIKNLILFFDGVAMLIPEYMQDHSKLDDLAIIQALKDNDLFKVIRPEKSVDAKATERLAEALTDIITSGALDELSSKDTQFGSLSRSRLGYYGDPELAQMLFEELKKRNLARDSEDGVSIPMSRVVRSLILVLLAQILRPEGENYGVELSPVTDQSRLVKSLSEFLSLPQSPSAGNVVSFDMHIVGTNLSTVPIEDILAFRKQNYSLHRNYVLSVKKFVRELSSMPIDERMLAYDVREEELNDIASDIRKVSRSTWKTPASFGLTIAGAAWTAVTGDFFGAVIGGAGGLLGLAGGEKPDAGAYSYLFSSRGLY